MIVRCYNRASGEAHLNVQHNINEGTCPMENLGARERSQLRSHGISEDSTEPKSATGKFRWAEKMICRALEIIGLCRFILLSKKNNI